MRGVLAKGTPDARLGKAIGELIGGIGQLIGSAGIFGGGVAVSSTGVGVIVGAPAFAVAAGLATNGVLSIKSGVQDLVGALNAMSSGSGVSQGPVAPHPAASSDKNLRVVNTKMGHAATRAVERAGFESAKKATEALRTFGQNIEKNGLPPNAVKDAQGHIVVPGLGNGGAVVYRYADGKLTLQTVLNYVEGKGTIIGSRP